MSNKQVAEQKTVTKECVEDASAARTAGVKRETRGTGGGSFRREVQGWRKGQRAE